MKLIKKLKKIIDNSNNEFEIFVAKDLLDKLRDKTDQHLKDFISDIINFGTEGGNVNFLIYHADTNKVFNQFESEITDLANEWKEGTGQELKINYNYPISDSFARFGYEEMTRQIAEKLGLEY